MPAGARASGPSDSSRASGPSDRAPAARPKALPSQAKMRPAAPPGTPPTRPAPAPTASPKLTSPVGPAISLRPCGAPAPRTSGPSAPAPRASGPSAPPQPSGKGAKSADTLRTSGLSVASQSSGKGAKSADQRSVRPAADQRSVRPAAVSVPPPALHSTGSKGKGGERPRNYPSPAEALAVDGDRRVPFVRAFLEQTRSNLSVGECLNMLPDDLWRTFIECPRRDVFFGAQNIDSRDKDGYLPALTPVLQIAAGQRLWIGSRRAADNLSVLQKNGIKAKVCVAYGRDALDEYLRQDSGNL